MKKIIQRVCATAAVAVAGVVGVGVGMAGAQGLSVFAPPGVTVPGADVKPAPAPTYPKNKDGLTYGSAAKAISPDTEPDLIYVATTDDKPGYVYKWQLDEAAGPPAGATPAVALQWSRDHAGKDAFIPAYALDGKTVVGLFVISGGAGSLEQQQPPTASK